MQNVVGETPDTGACTLLANLLHSSCGIIVPREKHSLLRQRAGARCTKLGLPDLTAYHKLLISTEGRQELERFLESMTVNTTSFFREMPHYDWLRETGIGMREADGAGRSYPLTVWSAACSTGQEAYSTAITIQLAGDRLGALRHKIIGTDLSRHVLRRAELGVYVQEEITGLAEPLRHRFLLRSRDDQPPRYRVVPELRKVTEWRYCNLLEPRSAAPDKVDIAFLRNVLIYFDPSTREAVTNMLISRLRLGGILLSGHSEPVRDPAGRLKSHGPSIYVKERAA